MVGVGPSRLIVLQELLRETGGYGEKLQEERRRDGSRGIVVRPLSHEAVQGEGLEGDLVGRRLYLLCCQSGSREAHTTEGEEEYVSSYKHCLRSIVALHRALQR